MTELLVVVSVDTEEDNWVPARRDITVRNIRQLPHLHAFLRSLGAHPTYLVSYHVLADPWAVESLRGIVDGGSAELGAHLHPWNTPPLDEAPEPRNTMLKNLPISLQRAKLQTLTARMTDTLGTRPRVFRAGRFALGPETITALVECGYEIDTSVTPFIDWSVFDDGPSFLDAPVVPYRVTPGGVTCSDGTDGPLLEAPITCGFTRRPFRRWASLYRHLSSRRLRPLRLVGIASRLGLARRVILSPETSGVDDMLRLSRRMIEAGVSYVHLFWHSSSLLAGLNPFVRNQGDVEGLYRAVASYLEGLAVMTPIRFATVGDAAGALDPRRQISDRERHLASPSLR